MKNKIVKAIIVLNIIITLMFLYNFISYAEDEIATNENITIIRSSHYKIDEDNKIISIVEPETDINTFKEKIVVTASNNEKGEYEIYTDETKKQVVTTGIIKTGMVLHTSDTDYPISVIGDINGDGKITQIDLSLLIRHIVGLKTYQLNGVKKISADISLDGKVDQRDLTKNIKSLVSGKLDIDKSKIIGDVIPEITEDSGAITFSKVKWSNGKASITISTNTNYTIQYQINSIGGNWTTGTESGKDVVATNLLHGNIVYARLTNGKNATNAISTKIEDIQGPGSFSMWRNEITTNTIKVSVWANDGQSGLPEKPIYTFYLKEGSGDYVEKQSSENNSFEATGLKANTEYLIKVSTKDVAGNVGSYESKWKTDSMPGDSEIENGLIKFSVGGWSDRKTSVTISTNTKYTIQYQVNSTEGEWTTGTDVTNLSYDDTVYARLTDGINYSSIAKTTKLDTRNPSLIISPQNITTNSFTIELKSNDNESGLPEPPVYTFYLKNDTGEYTKIQSDERAVYNATGLKANTTYTIKAEVKDKAGNVTSGEVTPTTKAMPTDEEVKEGDIRFGHVEWQPGKASVNISTITGHTIEYQVVNGDKTAEEIENGNWIKGTTADNLNNGDIVYARLTDGTNVTGYTSITITETTIPIVTITEGTITTNSINVVASAVDYGIGMPTTPIYTFYMMKLGGSYTQKQSGTSTSYTATGLEADTTYLIKAETKDAVGNVGSNVISIKTNAMPDDSEITSGAITFGNVTWSSGKASIEMSTSTDYTIQYQVNSKTGTWTTESTAENLSNGDIVYARLTDGTNATGYTSITIKDAVAPTGSITLDKSSVSPGEIITAIVTATDNESGINLSNCKWILNNSDTEIGTEETSYTGGNLASDGTASITTSSTEGTYYLHVLLKDNAGNKKEIVSNNIEVATTTFNYTADKMVEYDAGEWTKAEINTLKGLDLYNINIARSSSPAFTFGGFTYKGDTTNASNISNGTITTNRNKSIAPQSGCGTPTSDGWEVLEWGNIDGNKRYVKKLIHAGSPENFVFNYNSSSNSGLEAEYVLGGERETKYATYQPRSFDMYKDKTKENMIKEVHAMTYEEVSSTTASSEQTRTTGAYYFLCGRFSGTDAVYRCSNLYFISDTGYSDFVGYNSYSETRGSPQNADKTTLGIRPVIVLNDGVYVDISKHDGSGSDKYVLEMDE